ncbi:MAG: CocE/NonD family hydrolase [Clostridiales bacterium]|nr:CocE/NonD family hydrolase [Clostridiales bacterium]
MHSEYTWLAAGDAELFTVACLPSAPAVFPTIVMRSPYVDDSQDRPEQEVADRILSEHRGWLNKGYAVVYQHCRGRGKSSGDCVPYIYEREDGLALQDWVRRQPFYNGELYLVGSSYTASVHFVTAPFAPDIRGAVLQVQDCERYNCNYRNGFYKIGLHGGWYVDMYKHKSLPAKNYTTESYHLLPLTDFSQTVFGESASDFDEILLHPDREDAFWSTRQGGGEAHDAVRQAHLPLLLVTGFYDIYTGGIFDMWNGLDEETRSQSALLVHPYDHSGTPDDQPVPFAGGSLKEAFGDYIIRWLEFIRGQDTAPFQTGQVTYYRLFSGRWYTDGFEPPEKQWTFPLGCGERTYVYNPYAPASFQGGLSANFGGNAWQDPPHSRYDILTFFSPECTEDTWIKGKIKAKLCVKSDCEDTCFYVRLSLVREEGDYGLRDDINQISCFCREYVPGQEVEMDFSFDEHAFVIHKGEKIRVDISSSAFPHYVRHTNNRGLYSIQKTARVARNTIVLERSSVTLPVG